MARVSKAERTPNGSLPSGGALLNLNELRNRQAKELMTIAKKLDIDEAPRLSKQDLIYAVLRAQSANEGLIIAEGVLEILSEGYGFLRSPKYSYLPGPDDIYVSKSQIRSFSLRTGDTIGGQVHEDSYKVLKKGGRLVYLLARPFRDLSGEYGVQELQVNVFGHTANLRKVIDLAAQGVIEPVIGHSLDIRDFSKAFQLGESGKAGGKIVLMLE